MRHIIHPKKIKLYNALNIGYLRNERKQAKRLKRFGYILDKELTNNERLVAYSPFTKKVIFIENGSSTNPFSPQFYEDWRNNVQNISTGTFDYTPRFQAAKSAYLKAKKKYEAPITLIGHSQSAVTVNDLTEKGDKGYTLNGALIKQKDNPQVTNYRIKNDIVSSFANPNDIRTLHSNQNKNTLASHSIDNIRNDPIFL